jgi:alpha-galactosidase
VLEVRGMTTRREFLGATAASTLGLAIPIAPFANVENAAPPPRGFLDLHRSPDSVMVQLASGELRLAKGSGGRWTGDDVVVTTTERPDALHVSLAAASTGVKRVHLRWTGALSDVRLVLGDAWERGYGDLEWRGWVPDRPMPWYFATSDGSLTHAYGVRTGARAFCCWQVDSGGISLWADVRSGAAAVQLGERVLDVCDVVCRAGRAGESAFAALHAFCRAMCAHPRLPKQPVYGSNDWYWAYGKNSADTVRGGRAAHRGIVANGRQSPVRRDRRRMAARTRRGQEGRRHLGSRQREVRRHGGARR